MGYLIALALVTLIWCIGSQSIVPIILAAWPGYFIIRKIRMEKYFASEEFQKQAAGAAPKKVIVVPGRLVNLVL